MIYKETGFWVIINIIMADREVNERDKVKMVMITNIRGDNVKKILEMRLNARLMAFI